MNEHDFNALLGALERLRVERASTQEDARSLLRDEGIIDENGELTESFGGVPSEPTLFA